jgi:hypothetical protein
VVIDRDDEARGFGMVLDDEDRPREREIHRAELAAAQPVAIGGDPLAACRSW